MILCDAQSPSRGAIDKNRAVGPRAAAYLAKAAESSDPRPIKGVSIDDDRALFILRWYQELDAKFKVIKDADGANAMQSTRCKHYYLPLDNGGDQFIWTSNIQVICPVRLVPSKTRNRTFDLLPSNKKSL